jgi:hypothetical protein
VSTHYFRFNLRGDIDRRRAPLLERLLAGADASTPVSDWRADAFRLISPPMTAMPGLGATALYAERGSLVDAGAADGSAADRSVFVATPVHYVAEMSNVRLPADGILSLRQSDADALAADFNRVWNDAGIRLLAGRSAAGRSADLFCIVDEPICVATRDPEDVLDRHIENDMPKGDGAPRLRRLMSEIEMWLFEHAVNRARMAAGVPAVNGLWLWGGGPALTSLPPVDGWTAGDDLFFKAFAAQPDLPRDAASAVVVIAAQPGTDRWCAAESSWLDRSLADLRAGRIARLGLSAGNRCFNISARWRLRFWRRPRPWWEYFS